MERAASRMVRISFEASLEACLAMASAVAFGACAVPEAGYTRGRILTASYSVMLGQSESQKEKLEQNRTFSPVTL